MTMIENFLKEAERNILQNSVRFKDFKQPILDSEGSHVLGMCESFFSEIIQYESTIFERILLLVSPHLINLAQIMAFVSYRTIFEIGKLLSLKIVVDEEKDFDPTLIVFSDVLKLVSSGKTHNICSYSENQGVDVFINDFECLFYFCKKNYNYISSIKNIYSTIDETFYDPTRPTLSIVCDKISKIDNLS